MANNTLYYARPTNVTSTPDFFLTYINTASGGLWGYMILFMVFTISFMSLQSFNSRNAFAAASYITAGTTIILLPFNIVGTYHLTLTALMAVIALVVNRGGRGGFS